MVTTQKTKDYTTGIAQNKNGERWGVNSISPEVWTVLAPWMAQVKSR
jgi:hypothetical protein